LIFADDFTRDAPQTPMGDRVSAPFMGKGWCDEPGEFSIVDTPTWRARCEIADKKAICNVKHPDEVGSMAVSIMTHDEVPRTAAGYDAGQKWRLYLNVTRTVSGDPPVCVAISYYFAEYERLGGSGDPADKSWLRLGVGSGGSESILRQTQVVGVEAGLSRRFGAYIDDDAFCAGVEGVILGTITMPSPGLFANSDGWYSGFGMSEEGMLVDDFEFSRHYNSNPPETRELNCPRCGLCLCQDNTEYGTDEPIELPPLLNVCIWPDPDDCARLEQLEPCCFEIEYDNLEGSWLHEGFVCCGSFRVRFGCNSYDIPGGRLSNSGGCADSVTGQDARYSIAHSCSSETGDACYLFGPYFIADGDFACQCRDVYFGTGSCNYYITVSTHGCCSRNDCGLL